jgi:hypothetical protein
MAAECLVERLVEKNIISVNNELMSTLACSVRQCLFHEPAMEITKRCNSISFLCDREVSYNNKRHCLVIKLHQDMFCRPKNIQNILLNQNLGIRSIHNLSSRDLFGSSDNVEKIAKLSRKETKTTDDLLEGEKSEDITSKGM